MSATQLDRRHGGGRVRNMVRWWLVLSPACGGPSATSHKRTVCHTTALGVPGVLHVSAEKRFQLLKPDFAASPLMKLDFNGVFELLSVRAVHWYACHLPKVKLKLRSEKHAFGLPVERRKEGSQGV